MRKFVKTVLLASVIVLVAGLILTGAGVLTGAKMAYSDADFIRLIQGTVIYDWIY